MARHATGIGALGGHELEHGQQEVADAAGLLDAEVVFFAQNIRQGPVAQAVDVAELAFAVEDFLGPLAADAEGFGEGAQQLDDLRNVVVVFAVFGAGLGVEEVVACDKLESLRKELAIVVEEISLSKDVLTMAAILHTSVLAPHFAPRITSGERYCLV